uniref:Uncharacterized protein n=1 Tax=Arundo donax TaxID=35708 RepID=A0A0A8Y6M8_ARUDO
MSPPALLPP